MATRKSKEGQAVTQQQKSKASYKPKPSAKKKLQSKVAALEAALKEQESEPTVEEIDTCISASQPAKATEVTSPHVAATVTLKGILKCKQASAASE